MNNPFSVRQRGNTRMDEKQVDTDSIRRRPSTALLVVYVLYAGIAVMLVAIFINIWLDHPLGMMGEGILLGDSVAATLLTFWLDPRMSSRGKWAITLLALVVFFFLLYMGQWR
jgi:hypothetical protein